MKDFRWLLIIICCSVLVLVIGCTSNEDYTSYTCESRVLLRIPEPGDLGIYNTQIISHDHVKLEEQPVGSISFQEFFEFINAWDRLTPYCTDFYVNSGGQSVMSIDVFAAIKNGLDQDLLTFGVDLPLIEKTRRINSLPKGCIADNQKTHSVSIDIFCALKSGVSPDVLEEIGVRGNSLAWAQAVDSVAPYSTADSETGEIIVDITDALLKGIPPAVLVTVGFTQAEVDKAQAINQIYQYGTVDHETGDLIFTKSQISKALDEGVTQSAFLAVGIPEEAVDRS